MTGPAANVDEIDFVDIRKSNLRDFLRGLAIGAPIGLLLGLWLIL